MDHNETELLQKIKARAKLLHADSLRIIDLFKSKEFSHTPQGDLWMQMAKASADAAAAFIAVDLQNVPKGIAAHALLHFYSAQLDYLESQIPELEKLVKALP